MLKLEELNENKHFLYDVKRIYNSSFPAAERMPFEILYKKSYNSNISFFAVTERGEVKGLAYTVWHRDIVFLFYLAVSADCRGEGIGSEILRLIKEKYSSCRIVLNIEALDENAADNENRIKRKEFYRKNGFFDAGYTVKEYSVVYENLCCCDKNNPVTKDEYTELIKAYLGKAMYFAYSFVSR